MALKTSIGLNFNPSSVVDPIGVIEKQSAGLMNLLDPFSGQPKDGEGRLPFWSTGARSYIRCAGKAVAVCQDFRWQVNYSATPVQTLDSQFPWDIDIGQCAIVATLNNIMDPTRGPEADGLFHTMQSALHQPYVEMQILDAIGTSIFFARGMFTGLTGQVSKGALSTWGLNFQGVMYQHYVNQNFKPYNSVAGAATSFINGLKNLASTATGGLA